MGIKDSFTKMTFDKRCERSEGRISFKNIGDAAGMLQVDGMADSKALRWQHACHVQRKGHCARTE